MEKRNNESKDIFFRKYYTFHMQYQIESKIFDWLRQRFKLKTMNTDKGKLIIIERKNDESAKRKTPGEKTR